VPLPPVREQFRARLEMAHNADYLHAREAVLEFLYHKQAHVEKDAA
jgi:nitrate/nitrite transport system ATP-binding protein